MIAPNKNPNFVTLLNPSHFAKLVILHRVLIAAMPKISEITNEVVQSTAMNESTESSSLLVSSRGLQVRTISAAPSGSESSASSQTTLSPTHPGMPRRNKSREGPYDASLRGPSRHSRSPRSVSTSDPLIDGRFAPP